MRLLADENVHPATVVRIAAAGHDIEWIARTMPGASDTEILSRADIGALILVTLDRDFGELIIGRGFPRPAAVLYSRLGRSDPGDLADRILAIIDAGVPMHHIVTITRDGDRRRLYSDGRIDG